jgi:hypothetical protein
MQKTVLTVGLLAMALLGTIWSSTVIAGDEMCVPMEDITIQPLAADPQRTDVLFPHSTHFRFECQQCHHTWTLTEPIVSCTTSGCHDADVMPTDEKGRPVTDKNIAILYYKNAYHDMCIGCHKDIKAENKAMEGSYKVLDKALPAVGPTGCVQCHPTID